jgi:hypothetical protein
MKTRPNLDLLTQLWRRRWLRGLLAVLLLWVVLSKCFFWLTVIRPPRGAGDGFVRPQVVVQDGRTYVGDSWMSKERGILELHLFGEPVSLGYSHGRLGTPYLVQLEDYLFGEMRRYVPSSLALSVIKTGVLYKQRNLLSAVPVPLRFELAGLSDGQPDGQGDFLPPFQRIVFYHALHDITQTIEHSPLLGCTALAATGAATVDGHLYIGRNFDFEGCFSGRRAGWHSYRWRGPAWPGWSQVLTKKVFMCRSMRCAPMTRAITGCPSSFCCAMS